MEVSSCMTSKIASDTKGWGWMINSPRECAILLTKSPYEERSSEGEIGRLSDTVGLGKGSSGELGPSESSVLESESEDLEGNPGAASKGTSAIRVQESDIRAVCDASVGEEEASFGAELLEEDGPTSDVDFGQ
ncbi:UNVERIFIED_CONTAM: hypothetical protein K2H54_058368 [Gekko kuhli]